MKIKDPNRFSAGGTNNAGSGAVEVSAQTGAEKGAGHDQTDRQAGAAPISLAQLTGAVQSRRTYAETYRYTYVAPAPNVVTVNSTIAVADVQAALADKRIPNLGVKLNGNTATVDGLTLTFAQAGNGTTITGSAVGLQQAQVAAAVKKLASLATTHRAVAFIESNSQLYGTPQITLLPDGRIQVGSVASVRVNPKNASQAQGVLDQHKGGFTMETQTTPAARKAHKRTQVVG